MGTEISKAQLARPLLRVFCWYAAGLVLGYWGQSLPLGLPLALTALSTAAAFIPRTAPLAKALLLLLAGWLNLIAHTRPWSDQDLRRCVAAEPVLAQIRGHLAETPRLTTHQRDRQLEARTLVEIEVTMLRTDAGLWRPATGRVAATAPGDLGPAYFRGRSVEVSGVLARPPGKLAAGLFDYAAYLERRGVFFQLRTDGPGDWTLGESVEQTAPWTVQFHRWARRTLARGLPPEDPATGLVQAMTLGWNTALTDEIEEPFMKSGTMHVFAISGQHIALIAGILLAVLRLLRVPRAVCGALLIPLLWFYTAATGWQASAVRAALMTSIVMGGWSLQRPSDLLNSLAGAALVLLFLQPRQLFQASFQLSFMVVLALALVLPPLQERVLQQLEPEPFLPAALVPRWKRWLGRPLRWLALALATSVAAWIGSMALSAQYFHLFCPGSLLANVWLGPCAGAALASALASLTTGAWCPWLSEVFNHGAWFWMHCMMRISEIVADLPGAYRYVAAPSPALWTVYLVSFLAPALGWVEGARLRWWLAVSAALSLALLYTQRYTHRASSQLTALPLKGGLAIHLKIAGHPTPLLVDCGNTNAFHTLLAPFLRARGENRIHALALTHGEARHMDAAPLVLEHFKPATVAVNTARFRSSSYRHFLEQLRRDEIEPVRLEAGLEFAGWQVLHPPPALTAARADTAALVLRGRLRGTTFLLLSDLDRQGQRQLLDHAGSEALRAQIVVTGLPADGEPLMDDLLQAVRPELIVVGDDQWPVNRRASARLLARLTAGGAQVLSTSQTGAVTIRITDHAWEARPARPPSRSTPRKGLPPIRKWFDIPEQPIDPATDDTPAMRQGIAVNPSASEPEEKQNDP